MGSNFQSQGYLIKETGCRENTAAGIITNILATKFLGVIVDLKIIGKRWAHKILAIPQIRR